MADLNELLKEAQTVLNTSPTNQPPRAASTPAEALPSSPAASPRTRKPDVITQQESAFAAEEAKKAADYLRRSTPFGEDDADWMARNNNPPWWNLNKQSGRAMAWLLRNPGNAAAQTVASPSLAYEHMTGSKPWVFGRNTLGEPGTINEFFTTTKGLQRMDPTQIAFGGLTRAFGGTEPSYAWEAAEIAGTGAGVAAQIGRRALLNQARQMAKQETKVRRKIIEEQDATFDYIDPMGGRKKGKDRTITDAENMTPGQTARAYGTHEMDKHGYFRGREAVERVKPTGLWNKIVDWKRRLLDGLDRRTLPGKATETWSTKRGSSTKPHKKDKWKFPNRATDKEWEIYQRLQREQASRSPTMRAIADSLKVGQSRQRAKDLKKFDEERRLHEINQENLKAKESGLKAAKGKLAEEYHKAEKSVAGKYDKADWQARKNDPEVEQWGMAMRMTDQEIEDLAKLRQLYEKEGSQLLSARLALQKEGWGAGKTTAALGTLGVGGLLGWRYLNYLQNRNQ